MSSHSSLLTEGSANRNLYIMDTDHRYGRWKKIGAVKKNNKKMCEQNQGCTSCGSDHDPHECPKL